MQYVNLPVGDGFGWGVVGEYCTWELAQLGPTRLITPILTPKLASGRHRYEQFASWLLSEGELERFPKVDGQVRLDGPLLQNIVNPTFVPFRADLRGERTVGYVVFENDLSTPPFARDCQHF